MKRIVALGGEGIGPEVVGATSEVILSAGFPVKILTPPAGQAALESYESPVPSETKRLCEGLAPSGRIGDGRAYFESVHGSAPDIAGKGIANPTAALLSAAMLLEHVGLEKEGARLEAAVARVYREGKTLTPDQGGRGTTKEFCQAVLTALATE